jgi:hypothetical protein
MATTFTVTLDTTAPATVDIQINASAAYSAARDVVANISCSDGDTTGYQMKIWGDADLADNANIQDTEAASSWISYSATQSVKLSTGDGTKTLNVRVRDDVWNQSSSDSDTIVLDTTLPAPDISVPPDTTRVSKVSGKRTVNFSFTPDGDITEWKVKIVPSTNSLESAGTTVPETNGSTETTGGALTGGTPQAVSLDGRDIELASSGDGSKIVKIFVKDAAGNWSV